MTFTAAEAKGLAIIAKTHSQVSTEGGGNLGLRPEVRIGSSAPFALRV
jgi:hypothetical protein